jgi:quercetin dioxygenase-like cupin family protein
MTADFDQDRPPPRERFAGTEHVFDLRAITTGLRRESTPVRDGHRQMTIYHKHPLTLIVFDFERGGRLANHRADADVTILAVSGLLEVSTPSGTHRLPEGSLLVLDPDVVHDVYAPEPGQMLLAVSRIMREPVP